MSWGRSKEGDRNAKVRSEDVSVEESLVNHLSLPSQLPQREDTGVDKIEAALLSRLEDSALSMSDTPTPDDQNVWLSVCRSLAAWRRVTACGRLDKTVLEEQLRQLSPNDFLTLHIRKQNAAIFLYRSVK